MSEISEKQRFEERDEWRGRWLLPLFCALMLISGVVAAAERTVDDVLEQYRDKVTSRLKPRFDFHDAEWPPQQVSLVVFKDTRLMELWALDKGEWQHIRDYRIKGLSGTSGPKLQEGDRQVPEGLYRVEWLNPNSAFHLSMKLNYPNGFDLKQARREGRDNLGGDIFIHGNRVSKGCLAMGNNAAEELFVLAALIDPENISVLISPRDFRFRPLPSRRETQPDWVGDLNRQIAFRLQQFPLADKF